MQRSSHTRPVRKPPDTPKSPALKAQTSAQRPAMSGVLESRPRRAGAAGVAGLDAVPVSVGRSRRCGAPRHSAPVEESSGPVTPVVKDRMNLTGARWGDYPAPKPFYSSAPYAATATGTTTGATTSPKNNVASTDPATPTTSSHGPPDVPPGEPHPIHCHRPSGRTRVRRRDHLARSSDSLTGGR